MHCHAIQCFYVDFLRSKMAARRRKAAAPVKEKQALAALFFSSPVPSFAIDRRWSISQLPLQSHSESSLGRSWALRYRSRKWKQKVALNNGEKFMESKTGLHSSTDRSWAVLVRRSFKTRDFSGAVVCISLLSAMYTTIIDRQGTCWACFVWKDAQPPLLFPTTKLGKKSLNSVTVHL